MTLSLLAIAALVGYCVGAWVRQLRADRQTLTAYTQGYAKAHDDIYQALIGTPDEAQTRLNREAVRQRGRAGMQ